MATARDLSADLQFDVDRLPLPGRSKASDDALDVLDECADDYVTVERVREYARRERDSRQLKTGDFLRTLQHTDGRLALVTWTSAGITAVGYRPDDQHFDVGGYSAVRDMMGDDAEFYEQCTRAAAKDILAGARPDVVCRDEADLLGGESA